MDVERFYRILYSLSGFIHHGKTTHCMDVQHVYTKLCSLYGSLGHGVRYIMIF